MSLRKTECIHVCENSIKMNRYIFLIIFDTVIDRIHVFENSIKINVRFVSYTGIVRMCTAL